MSTGSAEIAQIECDPPDRWMSSKEVCAYLDVVSATLIEWDRIGILRCFQAVPNGEKRYRKSWVDEFVESRRGRRLATESGSDVPGSAQIQCETRERLVDEILDLKLRAGLLDQLITSARGPVHADGRITFTEGGGLDDKAWFAAVEAVRTPRPRLISRQKPLADYTEAELREFVEAEFAKPPAEPI